MVYTTRTTTVSWNYRTTTVAAATGVVLFGFWSSVGLGALGLRLPFVRAVTGAFLLTFVPGLLLLELLSLEPKRLGEHVVFAVGLSVAFLSVLTVAASTLLPPFGVDEPVSTYTFASLLTVAIATVAVLLWLSDRNPVGNRRSLSVGEPDPVVVTIASLPVLAALGATIRNWTGRGVGIAAFVLVAVALVLLASTNRVDRRDYPVAVFSISLATVLHRNLATSHVVGADVQFEYYLATVVGRTGRWAPDVGGSLASVPVTTAVPASYAAVTGLTIVATYKLVYGFVFSLVPLGVFYLAATVFDDDVGLYGALFFLFYHVSFYFTPGKQQLSQLFLVALLLLYLGYGLDRESHLIAATLLALGVVHSHYGTAYVFGFSVAFVAATLVLLDRAVDDDLRRVPLAYPAVFLLGATAWYTATSTELAGRLALLPVGVARQVAAIASGDFSPGTAASYVSGQQTLLERLNVYLYAVLLALVAIGLAWRTLQQLWRLRRGDDVPRLELSLLAVPFLGFFGSSYAIVLDLHSDRVFQLVLPVLAPFLGFGFAILWPGRGRLRGRIRPNWSVLAAVLAVLFVLNSGLAFAVVGGSPDYTFDEDAHDYAFSDEERAGAAWLENRSDIERVDPGSDGEVDRVPIYTDAITYQLFRSVTPEPFYNVEVVALRDEWEPTFSPNETEDGYVFVRKNAVADGPADELPLAALPADSVRSILQDREVLFENEDVVVVGPVDDESGDEPTGRQSARPVYNPTFTPEEGDVGDRIRRP